MKRIILPALLAAVPVIAAAQSPVQADALSQNELRGTARFMGMGGAFTALGGDLSTLGQNPAGIGVYTRSDVGITLDINMRGYKTETPMSLHKENQTKAFVNNLAYVGAMNLDGALRTFNWGVSYGRKTSFDRITMGYNNPVQTSLSNYIAAFSDGYSPDDLAFDYGKYNPYLDSDCDWLSILGYTSYMISPTGNGKHYNGLFVPGQTVGDAMYMVRESGYVDEYNIDLGGNVSDVVYWGIGVGINDISYFRYTDYSESMENANVVVGDRIVKGNAGFELYNDNHIWGSGWNVKLGLIVRPINELRIGMAVHTPTWYSLNHSYIAETDFSYYDPAMGEIKNLNPHEGNERTELASYSSKLNTPWRLMFGVAGVIDNRAIISLDYERMFYDSMTTKRQGYGYYNSFESATDVNDAIDQYYQGSNIVRLGLEYRVTPQFSVRLGYNAQTSNVTKDAADGMYEVMTTGTDPSYSFDKTTQYITAGLGYRYKAWYIDAAYVYKNRKSTFHAYTDFNGFEAPSASVTDNIHSIVLSTGFKF
ncbi:MAG: hypothetical protein K2L80_03620 [Muribaculaceae bacterium]|nr:hypothetical protein [Muribaculaceae bacterium]MDE6331669.1 hypothetical protein [Muribaculaceae bacterium]